jgi:hypothetical protein
VQKIRDYFDDFNASLFGFGVLSIPSQMNQPACFDDDYVFADVAGDGNCFFRSINYLINGTNDQIYALRLLAISVAANDSFWKHKNLDKENEQVETVKRCTVIVNGKGIDRDSWANHRVVLAMAVGLQWNIQIISSTEMKANKAIKKLEIFQDYGHCDLHDINLHEFDDVIRRKSNEPRNEALTLGYWPGHFRPLMRRSEESAIFKFNPKGRKQCLPGRKIVDVVLDSDDDDEKYLTPMKPTKTYARGRKRETQWIPFTPNFDIKESAIAKAFENQGE